jgi:hypothetical protein
VVARLAAILLLFVGCGRLDDVDVTRSASGTIPGSAAGAGTAGPLTGFGTIDLEGERALREEGIDAGDIDSARLRAVRLEVEAGASFERWLDDVVIRARSAGLPDVTLAERHGIRGLPPGTRALELDVVSGADLEPYLTAPSASLLVEATGTPPEVDTTVRTTATVRIDVNVSGLLH